MAENFQVVGVDDSYANEWANDFGQFVDYRIKLRRADGGEVVAIRTMKIQNGQRPNPPAVGSQVAGDLVQQGNMLKFKPERQQGGGGNFGGGGGQRSGGGGRAEDPKRAARIVRQHSQEMAVRVLAATGGLQGTPEEVAKLLVSWANWFDKDVRSQEAAFEQSPPPQPAQQNTGGFSGQQTFGTQPQQAGFGQPAGDDDIPF